MIQWKCQALFPWNFFFFIISSAIVLNSTLRIEKNKHSPGSLASTIDPVNRGIQNFFVIFFHQNISCGYSLEMPH